MKRPKLQIYSLLYLAFACCFSVSVGLTQTTAQEFNSEVDRDLVTASINPSGMQQHVPGRWATMSANGTNRSDDDAEVLIVAQIGDDGKKQFARRLWIPSHSHRQSWLSVLIPDNKNAEQNRVDLTSIRINETDQGETFQQNYVGQPLTKRSLPLSPPGFQTGVLSRSRLQGNGTNAEEPRLLEIIYQLRDEIKNEYSLPEIANYLPAFLSPQPQALDTVDQLIVINDGFLQDTTAAAKVSQWLRDGGRLWVMANRIQTQSLHKLMGESTCFTPLDRVELNEFKLDRLNSLTGDTIQSSHWSSDTPVTLLRGDCDADEIHCSINGWPVAFTENVGKGAVLVTTIDAHALVKDGKSLDGFREAFRNFYEPRVAERHYAAAMAPLADIEIGYQVPARWIIGAVLTAQLLLVLFVGLWLFRAQRLERLAFVIPATVCITTIGLVWMGKQNTSAVPPKFASGQFARVTRGGTNVQVDSLSAIYSDRTTPLRLTASPQTTMSFQEDLPLASRLLWTDDGSSKWMHVTQPPGIVRHIVSESTVRLPRPWAFKGQFTSRGFEGRFDGLDSQRCEDAIIVSDSIPTLALAHSDETWLGTSRDLLSQGQFSSDSILSDQRRTRQDVLRTLFAGDKPWLGQEPTLLFWTTALPAGLKIEAPFTASGSALVHLPIEYQRTPPATLVSIPPSFVRLELAASEQGFSTLYNPRNGQWLQDRTKEQSALLNCRVPESAWPCDLRSALVEIKISAPSRTLQIEAFSGKEFEEIFRQENPNGLIQIPINDPQRLFVDSTGALTLRLSVSKTAEEEEIAREADALSDSPKTELGDRIWQIDFLHVSLTGITK